MNKIDHLIHTAQDIMLRSTDPIHDLDHVRRVVTHTERLCGDLNLSESQTQALVLAAWWHDASRTITKNPSIVWMPFVDDMISALMLWKQTIRQGLFGSIAGMATRIIFCKNRGTGGPMAHLFLRKKNRIMVDILKDADALDLLHQERIGRLMTLADSSWMYKVGYKAAFRWFLSSRSELNMATTPGQIYAQEIMKHFIQWMKQAHIMQWHMQQFGQAWVHMVERECIVFMAHMDARLIVAHHI